MEDVRELAAFVAAADALHLGRAAATLGIARTTLTGRLRRLEGRLGTVLVDRSHRCRIAVTQDGASLLPSARRTVEAGRQFAAEAAATRAGRQGVVRVGLAMRRDDPRAQRLLDTLRAVDEGWRIEVVPIDGPAAVRSLVVGGLECILSDAPVLWAVQRGLPDPRPNRHEPREGLMVDPRSATRLRVTWRRRWAADAPHARALRSAARSMAEEVFVERHPHRARMRMRAQWTATSHVAAARREERRRRREERRLGAAVAGARAAARARRRQLLRLWKGYVRGDPVVCAFIDGTREEGLDAGLGLDPSRPGRSTPERSMPGGSSPGPSSPGRSSPGRHPAG